MKAAESAGIPFVRSKPAAISARDSCPIRTRQPPNLNISVDNRGVPHRAGRPGMAVYSDSAATFSVASGAPLVSAGSSDEAADFAPSNPAAAILAANNGVWTTSSQ